MARSTMTSVPKCRLAAIDAFFSRKQFDEGDHLSYI